MLEWSASLEVCFFLFAEPLSPGTSLKIILASIYKRLNKIPGKSFNNLLIPFIFVVVLHNTHNVAIKQGKIKMVMNSVPLLHRGESHIKLGFVSKSVYKSKNGKILVHMYTLSSLV